MKNLDHHLLICDPVPQEGGGIQNWPKLIREIANVILDENRECSPWKIAHDLTQVIEEQGLMSDPFGARVKTVLEENAPQMSMVGYDGLLACVCVMRAALHVLTNRRLSARAKRRDSIAVALWSSLSFQPPLAEKRLEEVRSEILTCARRAGLEMALRAWSRSNEDMLANGPDAVTQQNRALRENADLDRDEIAVLRWTLADESTLLDSPYADIGRPESVTLARGLELGLLLRRFPTFEHYELASLDLPKERPLSLTALVDALCDDRERLGSPYLDKSIIQVCPSGFPLLTALRGRTLGGTAGGGIERSLVNWCGRALLESSIVRLADRD